MKTPKTPNARTGILVISVLVTLTLLISLFAYWVRTIAMERQQIRAQQDALQAEYLAESGLERAAARLSAAPGYEGETWRIDAAQLPGRGAGQVQIEVKSVADQPLARTIHVSAAYPLEGIARVQRQRTMQINLPSPGGSP